MFCCFLIVFCWCHLRFFVFFVAFDLAVCDICCFFLCFSLGSIDFYVFSAGFLWILRSLRISWKTHPCQEIKGFLIKSQWKTCFSAKSYPILEFWKSCKNTHCLLFFIVFCWCHWCFSSSLMTWLSVIFVVFPFVFH